MPSVMLFWLLLASDDTIIFFSPVNTELNIDHMLQQKDKKECRQDVADLLSSDTGDRLEEVAVLISVCVRFFHIIFTWLSKVAFIFY